MPFRPSWSGLSAGLHRAGSGGLPGPPCCLTARAQGNAQRPLLRQGEKGRGWGEHRTESRPPTPAAMLALWETSCPHEDPGLGVPNLCGVPRVRALSDPSRSPFSAQPGAWTLAPVHPFVQIQHVSALNGEVATCPPGPACWPLPTEGRGEPFHPLPSSDRAPKTAGHHQGLQRQPIVLESK